MNGPVWLIVSYNITEDFAMGAELNQSHSELADVEIPFDMYNFSSKR